jgi:hypothetical protein
MSTPTSARTMSLASLAMANQQQVIDELEAGGVILLVTNETTPNLLGVLTRDAEILGEATLHEAIARGEIPPLPELLGQ